MTKPKLDSEYLILLKLEELEQSIKDIRQETLNMYMKELKTINKCQIDKIINDDGVVVYQIYYWNEKEQDWTIDVPFNLTDKQKKNHFETTENLEEAVKLIIEYNCLITKFWE